MYFERHIRDDDTLGLRNTTDRLLAWFKFCSLCGNTGSLIIVPASALR